MKFESARSVELVWLWWVVPYDSIIEHVVALIIKATTVVQQEWNERCDFAGSCNPIPNDVECDHFVPYDDLMIVVQLIYHWCFALLN